MAIQRMDHVGIVVEDLPAAIGFFVALGLELQSEASVGGDWVGRVIGLDDVEAEIAMLQTPDGQGRIELARFGSPPARAGDRQAAANTAGLRHVTFAVDDLEAAVAGLKAHGAELVGEVVRYENSYLLCYVRGPEGILVELAEPIG